MATCFCFAFCLTFGFFLLLPALINERNLQLAGNAKFEWLLRNPEAAIAQLASAQSLSLVRRMRAQLRGAETRRNGKRRANFDKPNANLLRVTQFCDLLFFASQLSDFLFLSARLVGRNAHAPLSCRNAHSADTRQVRTTLELVSNLCKTGEPSSLFLRSVKTFFG